MLASAVSTVSTVSTVPTVPTGLLTSLSKSSSVVVSTSSFALDTLSELSTSARVGSVVRFSNCCTIFCFLSAVLSLAAILLPLPEILANPAPAPVPVPVPVPVPALVSTLVGPVIAAASSVPATLSAASSVAPSVGLPTSKSIPSSAVTVLVSLTGGSPLIFVFPLPASNDGAEPNTLNPPPIVPPSRPAAIPTSLYSANASSLSIGNPACQRSNACCPISVGTSTAAPRTVPLPTLVSTFLPGVTNPLSRNLSPRTLSNDWPVAA